MGPGMVAPMSRKRVDAVKLRRGLFADLEWIFGEARDMCGSHDPKVIDREREKIDAVHMEVIKILTAVKEYP